MDRIAHVVRDIEPHDSVERYTGLGVEVLKGYAKIVDPWTVSIDLGDGKRQTLTTRSIVIATGAQPFVPPLPGLAEVDPLTSDTLWGLRELPARLVVLGGGPIGCELAQAFARLGSQVTQVEMAPRILGREDEEVSALARAALEADGVQVLTGHKALRCERDGSGASERRFLVVESGGVEQPHRVRSPAVRRGPHRAPQGLRPGRTGHPGRPHGADQRLPGDQLPQHPRRGRCGRSLPVHPHRGPPGLVCVGERALRHLQEVQGRLQR